MMHRKNKYIFSSALIFLIGLHLVGPSVPYLFLAALIYLLFFSLLVFLLGIFIIRMNYFLKAVHTTKDESVLLTFDDGPDPEITPLILNILKKHEVKAIFFVIGHKAMANLEILSRIKTEGHFLGNHSFNHQLTFPFKSMNELRNEIAKTISGINNYESHHCAPFRPPFGITNPNLARVLSERRLAVIGWSLRSFDTVIRHRYILLQRLHFGTKKGKIVLLHDTMLHTAFVLDEYIQVQKGKGIVFSTSKSIQELYEN